MSSKPLKPPKEVWITGMGAVSALGRGAEAHYQEALNERSGIREHSFFEGRNPDPVLCGLIPKEAFPCSLNETKSNRASLILEYAFEEAFNQAGCRKGMKGDILVGTTLGNMYGASTYYEQIKKGTPGTLSLVKGFLSSSPADYLFHRYKISGNRWTVSSACASGASAIGIGLRRIQEGLVSRVFAGGVDALSPFVIAGFHSLKLLSRKICRPFDAGRDGLNPGEGAAILVLESPEEAIKRGAKPLAVLSAFGEALEAYHPTRSHPEGLGLCKAVEKIFAAEGVSYEAVDHIHCHGTATVFNDSSEYHAFKKIFRERFSSIPVTSTKSLTGHTFGGAGALASVFSVLSLQKGWIPPTLFHEHPDPAFEGLNISRHSGRLSELRSVLVTTMGFGGEVAALLYRSHEEKSS